MFSHYPVRFQLSCSHKTKLQSALPAWEVVCVEGHTILNCYTYRYASCVVDRSSLTATEAATFYSLRYCNTNSLNTKIQFLFR
jgi:hypothetical protein